VIAKLGVKHIVAAMEMHSQNSELQLQSCATFRNIAMVESNAILIGEQGGIQAILRVFREHIEHPDACGEACAAIWNLALNGIFIFSLLHFFLMVTFQNKIK